MKKLFSTVLTLIILLSAASAFSLDRGHVHITGRVDSLGTRTDTIPVEIGRTRTETYQTITISGIMYKIASDCTILIESEQNGNYIRKQGTLRDILPGESVTARKIARTLNEIIVEEWKR